jgi:hypothetical protein
VLFRGWLFSTSERIHEITHVQGEDTKLHERHKWKMENDKWKMVNGLVRFGLVKSQADPFHAQRFLRLTHYHDLPRLSERAILGAHLSRDDAQTS